MNNLSVRHIKNKCRIFLINALVLTGILCCGYPVAAQQNLVTFAQFIERNGSQDFNFTNNNGSAAFSTISNGSPIFFRYQNIANLDASLQNFQDATLTLSSSTTMTARANNGTLTQPINGAVNTIQILRDTPASVGTGARRNLLTVSFASNLTDSNIAGSDGGNSATFSVTTPDQVITFSSDFLNFNNTSQRNLALSFSSVLPQIGLGAGGFLRSFAAAGSGTFASNPPPTVVTAPTSGRGYVAGRVVNRSGRGIADALLSLTLQNGEVISARTDRTGYFIFDSIETGQTIVLTARTKFGGYESQVFSFVQSLDGVVIVVNPTPAAPAQP